MCATPQGAVILASEKSGTGQQVSQSRAIGVLLVICFAASFVVATAIVILECFGFLEVEDAQTKAYKFLMQVPSHVSFTFRQISRLSSAFSLRSSSTSSVDSCQQRISNSADCRLSNGVREYQDTEDNEVKVCDLDSPSSLDVSVLSAGSRNFSSEDCP